MARIFHLLICLFTLSSTAWAEQITVNDLTYMTEDYIPYSYTENGEQKGIAVDTLKLIWKKLGYQMQPIKVFPWVRGYYQIQQRKNHVLFPMIRNRERENLFKWAGPLYRVRTVLIKHIESDVAVNSLADVKKHTIGTIRKDYAENMLIELGVPQTKLQPVSKIKQNIFKLLSGRIDLIVYGEKAFQRALKRERLDPAHFKVVFEVGNTASYYAFSKDVPDSLIYTFQKTFDSLKSERQQIIEQYLNTY